MKNTRMTRTTQHRHREPHDDKANATGRWETPGRWGQPAAIQGAKRQWKDNPAATQGTPQWGGQLRPWGQPCERCRRRRGPPASKTMNLKTTRPLQRQHGEPYNNDGSHSMARMTGPQVWQWNPTAQCILDDRDSRTWVGLQCRPPAGWFLAQAAVPLRSLPLSHNIISIRILSCTIGLPSLSYKFSYVVHFHVW